MEEKKGTCKVATDGANPLEFVICPLAHHLLILYIMMMMNRQPPVTGDSGTQAWIGIGLPRGRGLGRGWPVASLALSRCACGMHACSMYAACDVLSGSIALELLCDPKGTKGDSTLTDHPSNVTLSSTDATRR